MIADVLNILTTRWDFFLQLLVEHLEISFLAIAIAIIFGSIVGILISEYQKSAKLTLGVINFIYTIPSISMLGFLIPFSGIGNATAVIALTIYALLPMVRAVHTGLANVSPAIVEAAKGMGSTRAQSLFKVKLPLAMPVIMSGIRNMVTMTIALAGIASFIGAGGLGVAIYRGITTNNTAMTVAGSLLTAALALLADLILGGVEKRMQQHSKKARRQNKFAAMMALIVAGCLIITAVVSHSRNRRTIHMATKPMTEQYILGEMLKLLIQQDTDLEVALTQGVGGGTSNIEPAMESGKFDLYPEYTGTGWNMVLKKSGVYTEKQFDELQSEYKERGMTWTCMYGFGNTYGLAVRKDIADQYHIQTYSDLKKIAPKLTFGAEYDFYEREDGYQALCKRYGFTFGKTMDLDIGLKYQALAKKQIDVMVVFTTDGQLAGADAVVLKDDKDFFPSYLCGNVVRSEVLEQYPQLQDVFARLTGQIQNADMVRMNYEVEVEGKEPRDVAKAFLLDRGLIQ
jgi:osmoprotectant transport system permease protein